MSNLQSARHSGPASSDMPELGATFVPGGFDDYYMPEVIAPAPQRVMPEVPQNMQDGLQRMELEAPLPSNFVTDNNNLRKQEASISSVSTGKPATVVARQSILQVQAAAATSGQISSSADDFKPFSQTLGADMPTFDAPSFSPFPRVKGDNVPPSDEEKEEILYNARQHVLDSNNVSMQLVWARDSLSWVEISAEAHARENKDTNGRPKTPKAEHELRVDAINIVDFLASQGHPEALFMRSKWLEFGKFGYRVDKKEAYLGYKKAAEQGWGRAEYRMGMLFEGSNDMDKSLQHYNLGLDMKDSAAHYRLGMMSLMGQHGYRKDYQRGLELIQFAADTADEDAPQGAYVYGMLIARELPDINIPEGMLPVNLSLARQYVEKAAYLGFSKAQLKMGQAFELCQLGCDFNPALSLHYYGLAARQGQPEAALGVSRWFLFGYEGVFLKNEQLAYQYAQQAADAKLATGEFAMGYYHEIGIHVPKDLREARLWYEKAADHGNNDAINRLEELNHAKTLTKQDHETTALTRIKSQHGSQRGQRPERFRQKDPATALPTVAETAPPVIPDVAVPTAAMAAMKIQPPEEPVYAPPKLSPRQKATTDMPDANRLPAFAISIDKGSAAGRPVSTAPYPVDDRPPPLNITRPKSAAPYPEDDAPGHPPLTPHYNPQIRPSAGPQANRPLSAFGIRPVSQEYPQAGPGVRPLSSAVSTNSLMPDQRPYQGNVSQGRPMANEPPHGRMSTGWEPQVPGGPYQGQPPAMGGPYQGQPPAVGGMGRGDYRAPQQGGMGGMGYQQGPGSRPSNGPPPQNDPGRNRLSKANPNANGANQRPPMAPLQGTGGGGYGGPPGGMGGSPAPSQASQNYGPRTSSRPVSGSSMDGRNAHPERVDSKPMGAPMNAPQGHALLPSAGGRPGYADAGRQSAPPMQGGGGLPNRPQPATQQRPPTSNAPGTRPTSAQPAKPVVQGPATFEEMGIPQGKSDDDCCIM